MAQSASGKASFELDLDIFRMNDFEGEYKPSIDIQFYGMFDSCMSIANVCSQIAAELVKHFPRVALHSYKGAGFFDKNLLSYRGMNREAPVGIYFGIPEAIPDFLFDHAFTIGGFVCETSEIPQRWVEVCNRFDLIVVPSAFCRQVFLDSGVTQDIMVVQHGIEPEYRPVRDKARDGTFYFYNTFNGKLFPERKGCADLIECFARAFQGRDDVKLRLRTESTDVVLETIKASNAEGLIELMEPDGADTEAFAAIYSDVHCTVHPSRGEGFGLIPFQSIACETPVIAPRHSGMQEYLNEENALIVKHQSAAPSLGVYYAAGNYWPVDKDDLIEKLQQMEQQWDCRYEQLRELGDGFRQQYQWSAVLDILVIRIREELH